MDVAISIDRISEAVGVIDPVFIDSPQFECEPISDRLGVSTILKVECANPIRSFKGRGADYLLHRLGPQPNGIVCASAGNFGQGMAFAARKRGVPITVFAALGANAFKVERMRALGADVQLQGDDFDAAKEGAIRHAAETGALYVEDGLPAPIAEGAGTMAVELTRWNAPIDAVMVPLGNGSLVNGIGTWLRHASRATRVIISWRTGKPVTTDSIDTIANGIAVRVPVPEALEVMRAVVDEVMLVTDEEMLAAMKDLHLDAGLVVEPAGAAGLAAVAARRKELAGRRVAVVITGGNLTADQIRRWL